MNVVGSPYREVQGSAATGDVWITPTTSGGNADLRLTETTSGSFGMMLRHNGASHLLGFTGIQHRLDNTKTAITITASTRRFIANRTPVTIVTPVTAWRCSATGSG